MKKKNAILAITIGALLLVFIPAVVANEQVVERPLDDWLDANYAAFPWGEENWVINDFVSPYSWLVAKLGFPWPKAGFYPWVNDMVYENSLVAGDTIISGKIKERVLNTGEALITLHLDVKNAPLTVYDIYELLFYCRGWAPEVQAVLGEGIDGYIDYKVLIKFIIPYPGASLPDTFVVYDNYISVNIHGIGYGTLTEHAVELGFAENAGSMGMLLLHEIALYKPDFKEDHPKYDPYFGDLWPVETIEIFEL
ncbi:MAG: hypothetical protein ACFE96_13895 [Candidatus Hermodarchaeota archaeon]